MSKKENQDYDIIPVCWPVVIFVAVVLGICYGALVLFRSESMHWYITTGTLIVDALLIVGHNYILTAESITVRAFCIPYRKIPWEDIIQVGVARYGSTLQPKSYNGNAIFLTLKGCPKYRPGKDWSGGDYHMRHLFKTIRIRVYRYDTIKLFEKYYGILDYGYDRINPLQK